MKIEHWSDIAYAGMKDATDRGRIGVLGWKYAKSITKAFCAQLHIKRLKRKQRELEGRLSLEKQRTTRLVEFMGMVAPVREELANPGDPFCEKYVLLTPDRKYAASYSISLEAINRPGSTAYTVAHEKAKLDYWTGILKVASETYCRNRH